MAWNDAPPRKRELEWTSSPPEEVISNEPPTRLESGLRGAAQGVTFGAMPIATAAVKDPFSEKDFKTLLGEERAKYDRAFEAHPVVSVGSEIGAGAIPAALAEYLSGGAATPAVGAEAASVASKIPTVARVLKTMYAPASLAGSAITGGVVGGASSKGLETGDKLKVLEDMAQGSALGWAGGKYLPKIITPVARKVGEFAEGAATKLGVKGASRAMATVMGPEAGQIEERFARNKEILNAKHYEDIADDIANNVGKLKEQTHELVENAWAQLPDEPMMAVNDALGMIQGIKDKLKISGQAIGGAANMAEAKLNGYAKNLTEIGKRTPYLKATEMKGLVQQLDDDINWDTNLPDTVTSSLRAFRTDIDQTLKTAFPSYKAIMEPIADKVGLIHEMTRKFGLVQGKDRALVPSDATISKLKTLPGEAKMFSRDIAERFKGNTGQDIVQQVKDYETSKKFVGGVTQGSRKANMFAMGGAAVGGFLGSPTSAVVGAGVGGAAGGYMDKFGQEHSGQIVDFLVRHNPEKLRQMIRMQPEAFGKYGPVLENAIRRGSAGFAASHFLLQQNDPEYRKTMEKVNQDMSQ